MAQERMLLSFVAWVVVGSLGFGEGLEFGPAVVSLNGGRASASMAVGGFALMASDAGSQVAIISEPAGLVVSLDGREVVEVVVPLRGLAEAAVIAAVVRIGEGTAAEVALDAGSGDRWHVLRANDALPLEAALRQDGDVRLRLRSRDDAVLHVEQWHVKVGDRTAIVPLGSPPKEFGDGPPPIQPTMRSAIEWALIEHDWRMQDGIGTGRERSTFREAVERTLARGDLLLADRQAANVASNDLVTQWEQKRRRFTALADADDDDRRWEQLWRQVHRLRRQMALGNPLAPLGPICFVKQVPSMFSHQLTQYYGSCARPGGGVFVLPRPGESMATRSLTSGLPMGSFQHLDVNYDGSRLLFAHAALETTPRHREEHLERFFHLYEISVDGSGLRQLTDGLVDDFAPRYLPDGDIIFISTRRGGFHRCGRGPCGVYTLARIGGDGGGPRVISFHETHEWDPAVLDDGRVVYTRWDYVDRDAVYYQHLWSVRPDGSNPRILFGNNTYNPVGIWEARAVPGSHQVMATAGAHHAMTAGSIILVDTAKGVDGAEPITRLTPDALFPESESPVYLSATNDWRALRGVRHAGEAPLEARRWPGHCYRSPYPFSETYFLAAYSFDRLIGEPTMNPANMFGLYLVDRFGNKELLYRDLNISSLWPMPVGPRRRPPTLPSVVEPSPEKNTGTFFVQNVYAAWPELPARNVKRLRIIQVLPKSTPHMDNPPVGAAQGAPGKQVLGTVPVEADGSALFRAPARVPLTFQALDAEGQAVQVMRSLTYLQPGETASCVGCHEHRMTAPPPGSRAPVRSPVAITPGPEGSRPLSFARLVQPVLDRHCVECHGGEKPSGGVMLTDQPQGHYTAAYHALVKQVRFSAWGRPDNGEPLTRPGHFGAVNSPLLKMLKAGHEEVSLSADDYERLVTWIDANALFYGTFDHADQARQRRGEQIAEPDVQ
jgi:hypothetical protein